MNIFRLGICVAGTFCMLLTSNLVVAQSQKDKELLSVLNTLPEESVVSVGVYTLNSYKKISDVSLADQKIIIESGPVREGWSRVSFDKAIVPVWVSSQYVKPHNNSVKVVANFLNGRLMPSISAEKITTFEFGYMGEALAQRNGFTQLNAPASSMFLVKTAQLNSIPDAQIIQGKLILAQSESNPVKNIVDTPNTQVFTSKAEVVQSEANNVFVRLDGDQSHKIAPGDSISLLVFGETDLSRENIRVPENGNVSLPLIGTVNVSGKTTKQVEGQVRGILASGYVKNPRLSVSIFSYRPIFIRGAVESTGAFPYSQGLSIAKALALAGGALNSAKPKGVSVLRDGSVVESNLSIDSQYQISSGDVITIDEELGVREDENLFIYLHGEVSGPGEYRYRKGLTVEKAIVLAGGFTVRASRKKISITRYIDVDENEEPVKLKKVKLYTIIKPGDVINVRASLF